MIDPKTFAASTLALLQEDPRRYKFFGVYWYLVKEVLKRFYGRHNLYMLGDYIDQEMVGNMPPFDDLDSALNAAISEYRNNASFGLGRDQVENPVGGGTAIIYDPDAGI